MKAAFALVSLAALTFAGIAVGLFASRPPDYSNRVAELELKLKEADAEIAKLKADALKPKPPAVPAARSAPAQTGPGITESQAKDAGGSGRNSVSSITQMMKDPAMRDMVKAQQGMQIEMQYARLFTNLGLDDTEKAHFKKLITDRASAKMDMGFKLMDNGLSKEQRKAITDEFDRQKQTSDEAIRTFLNDENDYKTFQHWEETEPERMQMTMMGRAAFENAGVPLSPDQEEQLVSLMATVRKKPSAVPDMTNPKNISPEAIASDEMLGKITAKAATDASEIKKGAAAFLSPEQMTALTKYQDQMKAMTEMGLKMSRSMLGKDKK
ncbi:MAG: hypothetical protein JNJ83_17015 [Verrucomicrobiaceae bacterium]|nr:hypothetical protein [Verrucomicrobiaceae bacterium]